MPGHCFLRLCFSDASVYCAKASIRVLDRLGVIFGVVWLNGLSLGCYDEKSENDCNERQSVFQLCSRDEVNRRRSKCTRAEHYLQD